MKIKGPTGPGQSPPEIDAPDKAKGTGGTAFSEKLGGPSGPSGPSGPGGPGGPSGPDPVSAVAAELKAGKITPQQALERIVELVVNNGAAAGLPDKVKEKLRADLERMVGEDPVLAGKARRLGVEFPTDEGE